MFPDNKRLWIKFNNTPFVNPQLTVLTELGLRFRFNLRFLSHGYHLLSMKVIKKFQQEPRLPEG
jgi:hypothetical protein